LRPLYVVAKACQKPALPFELFSRWFLCPPFEASVKIALRLISLASSSISAHCGLFTSFFDDTTVCVSTTAV
jgi:hypothetical protein